MTLPRGNTLYTDSSICIELKNYSKGYAMPSHQHDFLSLSLLLRGNLVEDSGEKNIQPSAGFLSIKPAYTIHQDVFVNDCTILSLKVFDPNYYSLQFNNWRWMSPGTYLSFFLDIVRQPDKRKALAGLNKLLTTNDTASRKTVPAWLEEVHRIICRHYQESLSITELAKEVGRHPFHVGKMFEQHYGIDIVSYKRNLRLHHAFTAALMNKDSSLTAIAYESGFADQSHFNRDFKKAMSMSPKKAVRLFDV